jgi:hypothetical protein
MDLAIGVDGHDPNNSMRVRVASKQHRAGPHPGRVDGVSKRRPAQSVIVLGVQVSYEVDVMFHGNSVMGSVSRYGFGQTRGSQRFGVRCRTRGRRGRR